MASWINAACIVLLLLCTTARAQTKRALIIGIGNYPESGGWPPLSSNNDVRFIQQALEKQHFNDIRTLTDNGATIAGIRGALQKLVNSVQKNDIVLIHYSGHGEQIEDDNGDEADGLDESLVAVDARAPEMPGDFTAKSGGYFRDDDFQFYIDALRKKIGAHGDVVVFIDACHSGTGARGNGKVRGGKAPLVSANFRRKKINGNMRKACFDEPRTTTANNDSLAAYVVYSATGPEEMDTETTDAVTQEPVGSLSNAVCMALEKMSRGATYRDLFFMIRSRMNATVPGQTPLLEGDGADRLLFADQLIAQQSFYTVDKVSAPREIVINAGRLQGFDSGATVSVFPAGTRVPDKNQYTLLSAGKVISSGNYSSIVKVDSDFSATRPDAAWVFLAEPVYAIPPLTLGFKNFSPAETTQLVNQLRTARGVQFAGKPDVILVKGSRSDSIIIASNGFLLAALRNAIANTRSLQQLLLSYTRYKFLQAIEFRDATELCHVELLPVKNRQPFTAGTANHLINGNYEFSDGDTIVIRAENKSSKYLYINVLDLQPDGVINPVLPLQQSGLFTEDTRLPPGVSTIFYKRMMRIGPPFGTEVFKIFISQKTMNMEDLAGKSDAARRRTNLSRLEQMVADIREGGPGSYFRANEPAIEGSVYNVYFRIKPALTVATRR